MMIQLMGNRSTEHFRYQNTCEIETHACFFDERLRGRDELLQLAEDLKFMLRLDDLEDVKDFPEFSLHDGKLHIHERPVDGCHTVSCFGLGFQGDLVAVMLDPLPNRELPCLSLRDAQEQFSGFATLQGEGETDALNSSNSREESETHPGAVQLVSVLRERDKGSG